MNLFRKVYFIFLQLMTVFTNRVFTISSGEPIVFATREGDLYFDLTNSTMYKKNDNEWLIVKSF